MTAVCPDSLTAITSPFPKHLNTAVGASAESTEEVADTVRKNGCRGWVRWIRVDERNGNWTGGVGLRVVVRKGRRADS